MKIKRSNCESSDKWSQAVANGNVAPWTYKAGDLVLNNQNVYKAMWGGQEVPGDHKCDTEATCKNNGWQWMLVESCESDDDEEDGCLSKVKNCKKCKSTKICKKCKKGYELTKSGKNVKKVRRIIAEVL